MPINRRPASVQAGGAYYRASVYCAIDKHGSDDSTPTTILIPPGRNAKPGDTASPKKKYPQPDSSLKWSHATRHIFIMSDEGKYIGSHSATFSETRWYDRVQMFLPYIPREIPLFGAVTMSLWGVAEVLAEVVGGKIELGTLALPTVSTALVVVLYRAFSRFRQYVPEDLVSESAASKRIFRKGRIGWQFALARQMLEERVAQLDKTLHRVTDGAEFILPNKLALQDYVEWLSSRPTYLMRLVHATATQCTSELPAILASVTSEAELSDLKLGVEELTRLYKHAVDFEIESQSNQPPEGFENVHCKMYGWSAPVQDGVGDFMSLLTELASLDRKSLRAGTATVPQFTINFEPPENIDDFSEELDRIAVRTLMQL